MSENSFTPYDAAPRAADTAGRATDSGPSLAARLWPAVRRSAGTLVRIGVLGALAGVWGCGHANAPCPTPTSLLDEHRGQSEARQRDLARATDQADAMEARRDEALRRIQAAKALEDSLASRPAVTGGRKGRR